MNENHNERWTKNDKTSENEIHILCEHRAKQWSIYANLTLNYCFYYFQVLFHSHIKDDGVWTIFTVPLSIAIAIANAEQPNGECLFAIHWFCLKCLFAVRFMDVHLFYIWIQNLGRVRLGFCYCAVCESLFYLFCSLFSVVKWCIEPFPVYLTRFICLLACHGFEMGFISFLFDFFIFCIFIKQKVGIFS